jgi:uncharacterized membrane protein
MTETPERFWISRARLEALVDGIFAIAMTLLILEIRVPDLETRRSAEELLRAIVHLGPALFSYTLSFSMLAIFWYRHHRVIHMFRRVDLPLFLFTLVFLIGATLFPFCAAILGRYPTNPAAAMIYSAPIVVLTIGLGLQWEWAERHDLLAVDAPPAVVRHLRARSRMAPLFVGSMFCLLAGRLTPWAYAPLPVLVGALIALRLAARRREARG